MLKKVVEKLIKDWMIKRKIKIREMLVLEKDSLRM